MKTNFRMTLGWGTIILLSSITMAISVYVAVAIPAEKYSSIVSLVSSTASILAVIWFTSTLIYQSRQLSEQRLQFSLIFDQTRRDAQRNALIVADGILRDAENSALSQNTALKTLADIIPLYVDWKEMAVMLKSSDALEVVEAGKEWLQREGPAVTMMKGIQTAVKVYAEATSDMSYDFTKDADEFVYIYGPRIWQLPYFQRYQGIAQILTEFMIRITPGRKSALLAYTIAIGLSTSEKILNKKKLREDIEALKKQNYPVPEICKGF